MGLTMAATIALCVFTSAWIFGQIEPYVAEITGYEEATGVPEVVAADSETQDDGSDNASGNQSAAQQTPEAASGQPTLAATQITPTTETFEATHRSNPNFTVNFRPGPSVSSGDPIDALSPSTPIRFLDDEAIDEEGVIWLRMETDAGQIGWLREVDTEPIIQ